MYDEVHTSVSYPPPSCLDAAYERKAIEAGHTFDPRFLYPENKDLYNHRQQCRKSSRESNQ